MVGAWDLKLEPSADLSLGPFWSESHGGGIGVRTLAEQSGRSQFLGAGKQFLRSRGSVPFFD